MRRRKFITLLGGTAATWPFASRAQQRKAIPRVGVLWHAANAKEEAEYLGALTKAFHELGYVEGKNIELDHRFPAEQPERFRALAQELVESKVDVIVAVTVSPPRWPNRPPAPSLSYLSPIRIRSVTDLPRVWRALAAMSPACR